MLEEKIFQDYKQALKSKDKIKVSALSFLRSHLINQAKALKKESLEDKEAIGEIKRMVKKQQDSIEQFKKGNRQDLADKEQAELDMLKAYLPAGLSEEEIKKIIDEVIAQLQAEGAKDIGRVIKEVIARTESRADGRSVSDLVKQKLSQAKKE